MRPLKDYVDSHKMLGKIWHLDNGESGGDSAQRMGMYHAGVKFLEKYEIKASSAYTDGPENVEDSIDKLFNGKGKWRRHPDENRWYGDWDRMSRDQSIPILVMLGMHKKWGVLFITFFHHLISRGLLFMTNTRRNGTTSENDGEIYKMINGMPVTRNYNWKLPDPTFFEYWALYIRAFPKIIGILGYPILLIADFLTMLGGIKWNYDSHYDVLNYCITVVNANANLPTPFIWLTNKIVNWDKMAEKLSLYFREEDGPGDGDPPLHRIWIPLLMRLK